MSAGPPARTEPKPAPRKGTALSRARLRPVRAPRLRLIDAVALAAGALVVLKLVAILVEAPQAAPELPGFTRVVTQARPGYELADPTTTGSVTAKETEKKEPEKKGAEKAARAEQPQAQPPMPEPVSPTERALLEKLGARRDALKQKTDELELREKMLGEAERKLETGLGDLRQAEDKAAGAEKGKAEAEKAGLRNIVTMYETMKPKDAARVFDRLGHEVLVPLVLAMNPRKMAEVLAVMQPDSAERLTVALANRARGVAPPQAAAALGPNALAGTARSGR